MFEHIYTNRLDYQEFASGSPAASNLYRLHQQRKGLQRPCRHSQPAFSSFQSSLSRPYVLQVKGSDTNEGAAMAQTAAGHRRKWKRWLAI